jgi:hypothetical protein
MLSQLWYWDNLMCSFIPFEYWMFNTELTSTTPDILQNPQRMYWVAARKPDNYIFYWYISMINAIIRVYDYIRIVRYDLRISICYHVGKYLIARHISFVFMCQAPLAHQWSESNRKITVYFSSLQCCCRRRRCQCCCSYIIKKLYMNKSGIIFECVLLHKIVLQRFTRPPHLWQWIKEHKSEVASGDIMLMTS